MYCSKSKTLQNHLGALPTDHELSKEGAPGLGYLNGTNKTSKLPLDVEQEKQAK